MAGCAPAIAASSAVKHCRRRDNEALTESNFARYELAELLSTTASEYSKQLRACFNAIRTRPLSAAHVMRCVFRWPEYVCGMKHRLIQPFAALLAASALAMSA